MKSVFPAAQRVLVMNGAAKLQETHGECNESLLLRVTVTSLSGGSSDDPPLSGETLNSRDALRPPPLPPPPSVL